MKHLIPIGVFLCIFSLFGCAMPPATQTPNPPTVTLTTTPTILPTATPVPTMTLEPIPFLLSTPGSYNTGTRTFTFKDASRNDREVSIVVRYPAIISEHLAGSEVQDAPPDLTKAPYPIILSSAKVAAIFAPHLVSRGFITVGIRKIDTYEPWDQNLIDQPLDILFALDSIGSHPLDGLDGMLDSNRAGVMGYSFDGYNSLALSGARIDPGFYLEQCGRSASMEPALSEWRIWYFCDLAAKWDQFTAHAGSQITGSNDGLWQPMTDPRILAVMPMAGGRSQDCGRRELSASHLPDRRIRLDGINSAKGLSRQTRCDAHLICESTAGEGDAVAVGLIALKERGAKKAELGTSSDNIAMQRLAEAEGFVVASESLWFLKKIHYPQLKASYPSFSEQT